MKSSDPFPYLVIDDWLSPELCRAACAEWPSDDWGHWFRYVDARGNKSVSHDADRLPPACKEIVRELARLPLGELLGVQDSFPDLLLYGAGMSMIHAGGDLPLHLDSDHHPLKKWERAASAIVYLSECVGGNLQLWKGDRSEVAVSIGPMPGRLAIFECGDNSWHAVSPVVRGCRMSLSLFFWRMSRESKSHKRPRAEFATV
jgi:hypothetical protein